ncbi:MAG: polysaccharide biosynthesis/export family protein [Ignavibacteriales bacterium]|nr:polysaccharide biosynthesis/export family protein [Ignavibacteriales bacterium]
MQTKLLWSVAIAAVLVQGCSRESSIVRSNQASYSRSNKGSLFVKMQSNIYLIKQGDQIEISVWGYPEFNTTTMVKEGGVITIPLIGEVRAEGVSKEQFSEQVRAKLSQYIQGDAKIAISISSLTTQRVAVLGAVVRQENYPVVGEVSLIEILSSAGGATADSDLHRVKIIHSGNAEDPMIVDVAEYMENGPTEAIPMVRPGDTVFVPKKENVVREFSDFLRDAVLLFGFFRVFY